MVQGWGYLFHMLILTIYLLFSKVLRFRGKSNWQRKHFEASDSLLHIQSKNCSTIEYNVTGSPVPKLDSPTTLLSGARMMLKEFLWNKVVWLGMKIVTSNQWCILELKWGKCNQISYLFPSQYNQFKITKDYHFRNVIVPRTKKLHPTSAITAKSLRDIKIYFS